MRTERKNWEMGMFKMGAERFRNQFGVMGNSLRNNKKKNKQLLFSSTCQKKSSTSFLLLKQQKHSNGHDTRMNFSSNVPQPNISSELRESSNIMCVWEPNGEPALFKGVEM